MTLIPEVNKIYNYYCDGKINKSRRDEVKITEIVSYSKIDYDTLTKWKIDISQCHWLYSKETDYFIKGSLKNTKQDVIFVRTKTGEWFSLGWWAGKLDIDGSLTEKLNNAQQEA